MMRRNLRQPRLCAGQPGGSEEVARCAATMPEFYAFQGIANGHSFFERDLLHYMRGSHTEPGNPLVPRTAVRCPDDCAASRDVLQRTVLIASGTEVTDRVFDRPAPSPPGSHPEGTSPRRGGVA